MQQKVLFHLILFLNILNIRLYLEFCGKLIAHLGHDNKRQSPKVGTMPARQDCLGAFAVQADAGNQVRPCKFTDRHCRPRSALNRYRNIMKRKEERAARTVEGPRSIPS